MTQPPITPAERDRAVVRLRRITSAVVIGSTGAVGLLTYVSASTGKPASTSSAKSSTAQASPAATPAATAPTDDSPSLAAPTTAPTAVPTATPQVSSGGS